MDYEYWCKSFKLIPRSVTIDGEERKQDLSGPLKECLGWLESFFKDASSIASLPLPPLHMTGIKSGKR